MMQFPHRSLVWTFTVACALFLTPLAHGQQGTLSGTVEAGDTNEPLPGANVLLEEIDQGTSTDLNGAFTIEDLPAQSYTVRISFTGYETRRRQVSVKADQVTRLDVILPASSEEFDEVVVTGSKKKEKLVDAPVQMEAVSAADLEQVGGDTFYSALSNLKGIDFARTGINQQFISMRGFDSHYNTRLLQMKDGYIMKAPGNGMPQGNAVSTSELDIKRMEVVIGPASALYGPNAHSGVLNIITKTPWDESGASVDVRRGQQSLFDVNARVAGVVNENVGWKVTGQYMSANDYSPASGGPTAADSTHFFGTEFNESEIVADYDIESIRTEGTFYYRFGDGWQLDATYGFSQNDNFAPLTSGRIRSRGFTIQHQNLQLSNDHWKAQVTRTSSDEGDSFLIDGVARQADQRYNQMVANGVSAGQARQQVLNEIPSIRDSSGYQLNGKLWDAAVQYNNDFSVGSGSVEFITGFQHRQILPSSSETFLADAVGRDISSTISGGFLQADYRPINALRVNVAARVDKHSAFDDFLVSPKASVIYTVVENHNVRATYNRAFKSPTTINRHLYAGPARGNTNGFTIRSAPETNADVVRTIDPLDPEEVNSLELGYKGVFDGRFFVDVLGYNSWYSNFISPGTIVAGPLPSLNPSSSQPTFAFQDGELVAGSGFLSTYFNFGEATVRGVDLGLEYAFPEKLSVSGNLSYLEITDADRGDATQPIPLNVPNLKVKGAVTVQNVGIEDAFLNVEGRWKESYKFRAGFWDSELFYEDGKVPSRFSLNLTTGYTFSDTGLQLKASATNVLNTTVPDKLGSPETGRLVTISAQYKISDWDL